MNPVNPRAVSENAAVSEELDLYDVIEVPISSPRKVHIMARGLTEDNARAFRDIAVIRRGVEDSFYVVVRGLSYRDGEVFHG